MTAPGFTAHGKQVLALGRHYADAADTKAAEFIAEACEAKAKGGWQPIETAPRDGTDILVCVTHNIAEDEYETVQWVDWYQGNTRWPIYNNRFDIPFPPTHWMPLPSAPVTA